MGQAKRKMEENEANGNLENFLEEMLIQDVLKGALKGIAKQATDKGVATLSGKQSNVVDQYVENYAKNNICPRCENGNVVELLDLVFISENELCPMCDKDKEKFMSN